MGSSQPQRPALLGLPGNVYLLTVAHLQQALGRSQSALLTFIDGLALMAWNLPEVQLV